MRARRLAGSLLIGVMILLVAAAPATPSSPLVELVERLVPAHEELDLARDALAAARVASGDGSTAARTAARDYAAESDRHAARTAAVPVRTGEEQELREAMAAGNRALAVDLRAYAAGTIDGAELDRRTAAARERTAARVAELVPALAAGEGLDDTVDGRDLARDLAPLLVLVAGVVALGAITRRRSVARRSRTS